MKTKLVTLLSILLLFSIGMYAQKSKNKAHKVWVSKVDNSKIIKGLLYEASDESMKIIDNHSVEISIDASNIRLIKIRRKGKIGKGVLIGASAGLATGVIIGLVSGDEPDQTMGSIFGAEIIIEGATAGEKALGLGILMAVGGSGVGAIIASKKEQIFINGDVNNYKNNLVILKNYSMMIHK